MHALDMEKREVHSVKVSGGPYSTSLFKIRITFSEGVDPESVPLAVQWYRSRTKGRFERIKGATNMAYFPNADDMMSQLGVACMPCAPNSGQVAPLPLYPAPLPPPPPPLPFCLLMDKIRCGDLFLRQCCGRANLQALGMSFFASTKPVKIDPELSMLVKHLISNGYAEFKIRLISAKASAGDSRDFIRKREDAPEESLLSLAAAAAAAAHDDGDDDMSATIHLTNPASSNRARVGRCLSC